MPIGPPRFAILVCTHNGAQYLPGLLDSLTAQTLPPAAIVIHDWGSTDDTRRVLQDFAAQARGTDGQAIRVAVQLHEQAPGAQQSFVAGLRHCLSSDLPFDYLALCDQDDRWHDDKLAAYAAAIAQAAEPPGLLYSDVHIVDARGAAIATTHYGSKSAFAPPASLRDPGLLLANPVIGMTMAMRRESLADCQALLDGPWLMHDWALALLAVTGGHTCLFVPKALVDYRQHGGNVLGAGHGLRLVQRIRKMGAQFKRLRHQAAHLGAARAGVLSPAAARLARAGAGQRWHAASIALTSRLLRPHSRLLLAAAIVLFW